MKNWLKKQLLEVSFWAGLTMIIGAFFFPAHTFIYIGLILIIVDDQAAAGWLKGIAPLISAWIDEV